MPRRSAPHSYSKNRVGHQCGFLRVATDASPLRTLEKKELLLDDGSADRVTEIIAGVLAFGNVLLGVGYSVRRQSRDTVVLPSGAVKVVGSRLCGNRLTMPPEARPYCASKLFVMTRYSCTASIGQRLSKRGDRTSRCFPRRPQDFGAGGALTVKYEARRRSAGRVLVAASGVGRHS